MIASRLNGPRLRKGLSRMKPLALGLDGGAWPTAAPFPTGCWAG